MQEHIDKERIALYGMKSNDVGTELGINNGVRLSLINNCLSCSGQETVSELFQIIYLLVNSEGF